MRKKNRKQPHKLEGGHNLDGTGAAPSDPVAAMAQLSADVADKVTSLSDVVDKAVARVADAEAKITAAEQTAHDAHAKLEELKAGDQYAELADRLEKDEKLINDLDTAVARAKAMGGGSESDERKLSNQFAQELATGEGLKRYRELAEHDKRAQHRFKIKHGLPFSRSHGFAGESNVVIDNDLIGDGSDPIVQQGLTELIRDPIGLVDVINETMPMDEADAYKEMVEDVKSNMGFVVAAANGAQDGATTPQAYVTVSNTEGFYVGQAVYVHTTAAGLKGPHTISAITAGTTITFATAVIDYLVEDGSLVTGEEFVATAESGIKPAGVLSASMKSVDVQTLATYLIMTRQALRRTNLFDLGAWASRRLPLRLRESLEWHLLYGSGTAPQLHGLLNSTQITAFSVSTDTWSTDLESGANRADCLLWSAANIPGNRQAVAVMHKLDWWKLTNAKDLNGNYVHGQGEGPAIINTPAMKAIGGLQVVLSSKIAANYALVMDPAQASTFVRMNDAEMVVGYVNDQLISNQQTMLYEQSFAHLLKVGTAWRRVYLNAPPT